MAKKKTATKPQSKSQPNSTTAVPNSLDKLWSKSRNRKLPKDIRKIEPGIYTDLTFPDYCQIDAINRSALSLIKHSLLHYKYATAVDETPSMAFGSLAHCGRLEPSQLTRRYVVIPPYENDPALQLRPDGTKYDNVKMTKAYKLKVEDFLKQHPDKIPVSQDWLNDLTGLMAAIDRHPVAGPIFSDGRGQPEVTIVWIDPDTGLRCKARIDWVHPTSLNDVKTTDDCTEFYLNKFDYHIQAPFYSDGWQTLTNTVLPFNFCVVEKKSPWAVRHAPTSPAASDLGRHEYQFLLARLAEAKRTNHWPGPTDPEAWDVFPTYRPYYMSHHTSSTGKES